MKKRASRIEATDSSGHARRLRGIEALFARVVLRVAALFGLAKKTRTERTEIVGFGGARTVSNRELVDRIKET